ncbi:MAG: hypothetical protein GYB67_02375, partial [Chloroflexi bacterium]|nr:hypothetical protein [Chloroflexota bacterium]
PITLPWADGSPRGLTLAQTPFLVRRVSVAHSSELGGPANAITLTLEAVTAGEPGATAPVATNQVSQPGWTPPGTLFPESGLPTTPPGQLSGVVNDLALFSAGAARYFVTGDFRSASPTYTERDLAALGMVGTLVAAVQNAFNLDQVWVVTQTHIGRVDGVFGAPSYSQQFTFRTSTPRRSLQTERGFENFVVVSSYYSDGVWVTWTTDGVNWVPEVQVTPNAQAAGQLPGIHVSPRVYGKVITSAVAGGIGQIHVDDDLISGASFAPVSGTSSFRGLAGEIHVPYHDNPNEDIFYYGWYDVTTVVSNIRLYRHQNGISTEVSPLQTSLGVGPAIDGITKKIHTCDLNRRLVLACLYRWDTQRGVWTSTDGGDTWTERVGLSLTTPWAGGHVSSDQQTLYLWGAGIAVSPDFGATITDKSGDLPSNFGVSNIFGR